MAIIVDIIASVDPQQTVTCSIGDHVDAVAARELARDGLAQRPLAPRDRVLVVVGVDRRAGGVLDGLRRGEIGKSLRQIDGVVRVAQPRHLADDRLGELQRLLRSREFGHRFRNRRRLRILRGRCVSFCVVRAGDGDGGWRRRLGGGRRLLLGVQRRDRHRTRSTVRVARRHLVVGTQASVRRRTDGGSPRPSRGSSARSPASRRTGCRR